MSNDIRLARAIYDFETSEPEEIALQVNDIVQILNEVNADWWRGQCKGVIGNFPVSYVEILPDERFEQGHKLFVGTNEFPELQPGDLPFTTGDIVIGIEKINEDWWKGRQGKNSGIFPLTHVQELPVVTPLGQSKLDIKSHASPKSDGALYRVRALADCQPQLKEELGCSAGDIIEVLREVDSDWLLGRISDRQGIILRDLTEPYDSSSTSFPTRAKVDGSSSLAEAGHAVKPITKISAPATSLPKASFPSTVAAPSPGTVTASCELKSGQHKDTAISISLSKAKPQMPNASIGRRAKVLFDFTAQSPNELPLMKHEVVMVTSTVDKDWSYGTNGIKSGIFPTSFVQMLEAPAPAMARVMYNFTPESAEEIQLAQGESVFILLDAEQGWTKVRTASGAIGLCPKSFLQPMGTTTVAKLQDGPSSTSPAGQSAAEVLNADHYRHHTTTRERPVSSTLDNLVAMEMAAANAAALRRQSLQIPKPPKPPGPPKLLPSVPLSGVVASSTNSSLVTQKDNPMSYGEEQIIAEENRTSGTQNNQPRLSSSPKTARSKQDSPKRPPDKPQLARRVEAPDLAAVCLDQDKHSEAVFQKEISQSAEEDNSPSQTERMSPLPTAKLSPAKPAIAPRPQFMQRVDSAQRLGSPVNGATANGPAGELKLKQMAVTDAEAEATTCNGLASRTLPPPIPTRPAPAPPQGAARTAPSRSAPARPAPAPPGHSVKQGPDYNEQVAEDMRHKIQSLESDIEKYNDELEKLDGLHDDNGNLNEKLEFYVENINGMTHELHELKVAPDGVIDKVKATLAEMESASSEPDSNSRWYVESQEEQRKQDLAAKNAALEKTTKMKEKRERVISEILETEESYLKDLRLCIHVFLSEPRVLPPAPADLDIDTLFGNMSEIVAVSQRLLNSLQNSLNNVDFEHQLAGKPLYEYVDELKSVYGPYCRNHDDVSALLEQYRDNEPIQNYFKQGLDELSKHTTVFTIGAFLIKPVQRILKYPLLLDQLNKATEDSHPDKPCLAQAIVAQHDVANHINEYKRRKDLVYKYRQEKDERLTDKMSRLTLHSIKKKSNRFSMRLSSTMGLAEQTKDKDFEREANNLRALEKGLRSFSKNVACFMDQLVNSAGAEESFAVAMSEYYGKPLPSQVAVYLNAQKTIASKILNNLKTDIEENVLSAVRSLTTLFHSPLKLIEKRDDKLLDYDSCVSRLEKIKDADKLKLARDEMQIAKNDYEALNVQLLLELPKFNSLAGSIYKDSVACFARAYGKYQSEVLNQLYPLLMLPGVDAQAPAPANTSDTIERFTLEHNQIAELMFGNPLLINILKPIKKQPNESRGRLPSIQYSAQSDSTVIQLRSKYKDSQLYTVCTNYTSSDPQDITASKGDLLGVLVRKDPMGNSNKWYVDNGAEKGFIHCSHLTPVGADAPDHPDIQRALYASSGVVAAMPEGRRSSRTAEGCGGSAMPSQAYSGQVQDPVYRPLTLVQPSQTPMQIDPTPIQPSLTQTRLSPTPTQSTHSTQQTQNTPANVVHDVSAIHPAGQPPEYWLARYSFAARNSNEISLVANQAVYVYTKHDEQNNPQWWYVQTHEGFGYAPADYLTFYRSNTH